jgi:hypothetical protein
MHNFTYIGYLPEKLASLISDTRPATLYRYLNEPDALSGHFFAMNNGAHTVPINWFNFHLKFKWKLNQI